jgi:hypothetical protein
LILWKDSLNSSTGINPEGLWGEISRKSEWKFLDDIGLENHFSKSLFLKLSKYLDVKVKTHDKAEQLF